MKNNSWIGHPPIELGEPQYLEGMKRAEELVAAPPEVTLWMSEAVDAMEEGLRALHDPGFLPLGDLIDTSQAPYTVPCPTCLAFALEACRHERRRDERQTVVGPIPGPWPSTSRMVKAPHAARHRHWAERPEYRVVRTP
jgi:hypothetical protein